MRESEGWANWRAEYPQLSPHHIRMAVGHWKEDAQIRRELDTLVDVINRVIGKYRDPDGRQIAIWRRQFPYLSPDEIRAYFIQRAEDISNAQDIFVSSVFPNMGEIALERETKQQRHEYLYTSDSSNPHTENVPAIPAIVFLTSLSARIINAVPALAFTSVSCCWCTTIITRNPQLIPPDVLLPTFWYELVRVIPISAVIARIIQGTLSDTRDRLVHR